MAQAVLAAVAAAVDSAWPPVVPAGRPSALLTEAVRARVLVAVPFLPRRRHLSVHRPSVPLDPQT